MSYTCPICHGVGKYGTPGQHCTYCDGTGLVSPYTSAEKSQTNHCQQCEELQAQIAKLREAAKEMLAAEQYSSRPPETVIEAERKLDRIRKAARAVDQTLSETADNDKWLADVKADAARYRWILSQGKLTDAIFVYLKSGERHVSNAIDNALPELSNLSGQAKKGGA